MRTTKDIEITDNGNTYKYRLTKLSALGLARWGERVICALAAAGILDQQASDLTEGMALIGNLINQKGFSFLGGIDCDKTDKLMLELVEKTATRMAGAATIKVDEKDLESTFEDIGSLFELVKECLAVNFPAFVAVDQSGSQQSPQTENTTTKRGISVKRLPH